MLPLAMTSARLFLLAGSRGLEFLWLAMTSEGFFFGWQSRVRMLCLAMTSEGLFLLAGSRGLEFCGWHDI